MIVPEDKDEGAQKEVEDTEDDSRVDAQAQAHWLKEQQLKWPMTRVDDGLGDGSIDYLDWSMIALLTRLFTESACFVS